MQRYAAVYVYKYVYRGRALVWISDLRVPSSVEIDALQDIFFLSSFNLGSHTRVCLHQWLWSYAAGRVPTINICIVDNESFH